MYSRQHLLSRVIYTFLSNAIKFNHPKRIVKASDLVFTDTGDKGKNWPIGIIHEF